MQLQISKLSLIYWRFVCIFILSFEAVFLTNPQFQVTVRNTFVSMNSKIFILKNVLP
jgi:hypothetical protein